MAKPPQLTPAEAKEKILKILDDGETIPTYHFKKDRKTQRNAPWSEVLYVLQTGEIKRNPEWDEEYQNWVCNVEGYDLDNDKLIVVTAIIERNWQLKVITVKG